MIIALSRFTIANGMADEVRTAFRDRHPSTKLAVPASVLCPPVRKLL